MIKELLLTTTLLAPGLAYGQVSAPLDPPVIPAPAAAAGFTNHILAADFTSPAYSNTANFIVNCGASPSVSGQPSTWHWYINYPFTSGQTLPCRDAIITSDGALPQVLQYTFPPAQWSSPNHLTGNLVWPGEYGTSYANGYWLPTEIYIKVVLRVPQTTWVPNPGDSAYTAIQQSIPPGGNGGGSWLDTLTQETECGGPSPCPSHGLINTWPGNGYVTDLPYNFPGGNYTGYQTIEAITTSDESTNEWECIWLNANATYTTGFVGCNPTYTTGFNVANLTKAHDMLNFISIGNIYRIPANNLPVYFKSIDIWTCPGAPASTCPGTMITHWPFA